MKGLDELEQQVHKKLRETTDPAVELGMRAVLNFIIRLHEIERDLMVQRYNKSREVSNAADMQNG